MRAVGAGALVVAAFLLLGCSPVKYVPVCSEHGGVRSVSVPDHTDEYATRDVLCKDGITQRPEQVEQPNGSFSLVVPSER